MGQINAHKSVSHLRQHDNNTAGGYIPSESANHSNFYPEAGAASGAFGTGAGN